MKGTSTDRLLTLGMALYADKKTMERRVRGIFGRRSSTFGALFSAALMISALLLGCFTTACQPAPAKATLPPSATAPAARTPAPTPVPDPTAAPTETPVPTPTIDPNDLLQGRYAERFVEGVPVKTEGGYQSETVSVTIDRVQTDSVTYYVADIYIKYIESFRTGLALEHSSKWMSAQDIAKANDAILAISGDFYGARKSGVVAVRNGQEQIKKLPSNNELLVMYNDGRMETIAASDADVDGIYAGEPYQIWCFGPALLRDGRAITEFTSAVNARNPRSAIGYFEPGHYCFVLVDGRQSGYSVGMTLAELAQTFEALGCTYAYNLDGGDTAVMIYDDAVYSHPKDKPRNLSDILYIADTAAQQEGGAQ